MKIDELKSKPA